MDPLQVILRVALIPAGLAWVSGRLLRGASHAGLAALTLGAFAAYVGVVGPPRWPMVAATHKLWLAVVLGGLGAFALERLRGAKGLGLAAALNASIIGWLFFRKFDHMDLIEASLCFAGLPLALALLARGGRHRVGPALLGAAALSGAQMQGGSFVLSFLCGGVFFALLGGRLAGLDARRLVPPAALPLGAFAAQGVLYGELSPLAALVCVGVLAMSARR